MTTSRTSRWFPLFSVSLLVLGFGTLGLSWAAVTPQLSLALLILMSAAFVSENVSLPLPRGGTTSLAFPMTVAAALLLGPVGAGLVSASCTVTVREVRRGKPLFEILGNAGQLLLSGILPAWLYLLLGGRTLLSSSGPAPLAVSDFPHFFFLVVALVLGIFVLNGVFVGTALWLRDGIKPGVFARAVIPWALPVQTSLGVLGIAIAQVLTIHPFAMLLLVFPLIVARQTYQRYQVLKGLYLDTVRSLVAALEAKDPYTRGHSERVAHYVAALAVRLGFPEERVERLAMAAQLHDLGKVAIASEILQKPGSLSADELQEIRLHPQVGAEIVSSVPALEELADIVRHHHERFDGLGYCSGLTGDEILLESRMLALADSYDAMTTGRAYRRGISTSEAIAEIEACSGTQFDPDLAPHFVAAIGDTSRES